MKKILFITNRNILTISGELRLIKNRAEVLFNVYEYLTDFICLANDARVNAPKHEIINAGGKTISVVTTICNLLSFVLGFRSVHKLIVDKVKNGNYDAIILSGVVIPIYAKRLCKYNVPIYLDIHGASEDMIELSNSGGILKNIFFKVLYLVDKLTLSLNFRYTKGSFVVTDALAKYLTNTYVLPDNYNFFIIPCATGVANDSLLSCRNQYRDFYREKYNINSSTKVFLYSGGLSPWQCVEDTIELYKKLSYKLNAPSKMIIFSHKREELNKMIGDSELFIIDSYSPDELSKAIFVSDFAFMLRKDCYTNNVAFPNKFLEYVQGGLPIITTPFVHEIADQVSHFNCGYLYDFSENLNELIEFVSNTATLSNETINEILSYNSFESRLKSFVSKA